MVCFVRVCSLFGGVVVVCCLSVCGLLFECLWFVL